MPAVNSEGNEDEFCQKPPSLSIDVKILIPITFNEWSKGNSKKQSDIASTTIQVQHVEAEYET